MRRPIPTTLCLVLLGCTAFDRSVTSASGGRGLDGDSVNMRRVMGLTVAADPLASEPGDIWADLLTTRPNTERTQQSQRLPPIPVQVAGSTPAAVVQSINADRPIRTDEAAFRNVSAESNNIEGPFFVQLAATNSEVAARTEWQNLRARLPQLMGDRAPTIMPTEIQGRQIWRLRTGEFANSADANGFCAHLEAEHSQCWATIGGQ
jgi:SPOR domain